MIGRRASVLRLLLAAVLAGAAAAVPGPIAAQEGPVADADPGPPGGTVYLTRDEALREIFPGVERAVADGWRLTPEEREVVAREAAVERPETDQVTYRVFGAEGELLGYAMVLNERGKYRPITFMVGATPELRVRGVEVMVYREDRGEEVRYERFLRQYRGKRAGDPVRTHRDITNVTGATISVRSMNRGVRKALAVMETVYGAESVAARGPQELGSWSPGGSR